MARRPGSAAKFAAAAQCARRDSRLGNGGTGVVAVCGSVRGFSALGRRSVRRRVDVAFRPKGWEHGDER